MKNDPAFKELKEHIRPNKKKIPVFRVTRTYLKILVKPRIFLGFLEEIMICEMPFKMHKINFFFQKKLSKKYVCLPYLKFSDPLPETFLFFFIWHNYVFIEL